MRLTLRKNRNLPIIEGIFWIKNMFSKTQRARVRYSQKMGFEKNQIHEPNFISVALALLFK